LTGTVASEAIFCVFAVVAVPEIRVSAERAIVGDGRQALLR
jgi:hypothetical protein